MSILKKKYCQNESPKDFSKKLTAVSYQLLAFPPHFLPTAIYNLLNIFFTSVNSSRIIWQLPSLTNRRSFDKIIWYSSSEAEPSAMFKKYANWESLPLPQPSAIFVGIEDAERRICVTSPYISSFGKLVVSSYTRSATLCDFSHTFKSLKFFISQYNSLVKAVSCPLIADCFNQVRHTKPNSLQKFKQILNTN